MIVMTVVTASWPAGPTGPGAWPTMSATWSPFWWMTSSWAGGGALGEPGCAGDAGAGLAPERRGGTVATGPAPRRPGAAATGAAESGAAAGPVARRGRAGTVGR